MRGRKQMNQALTKPVSSTLIPPCLFMRTPLSCFLGYSRYLTWALEGFPHAEPCSDGFHRHHSHNLATAPWGEQGRTMTRIYRWGKWESERIKAWLESGRSGPGGQVCLRCPLATPLLWVHFQTCFLLHRKAYKECWAQATLLDIQHYAISLFRNLPVIPLATG